ncbi:MAG: hypothetical protein ACFBSD_12740 [Paracoccaceae bacterium]
MTRILTAVVLAALATGAAADPRAFTPYPGNKPVIVTPHYQDFHRPVYNFGVGSVTTRGARAVGHAASYPWYFNFGSGQRFTNRGAHAVGDGAAPGPAR